MSRPLTDQLRAYFDDVDRQQGPVDIDALRRSVEERVFMIELSPDTAVPPNGPTSGRRWPILIAAAATFVLVVGALVVFGDDDATPADQPSPAVTVPPTTPPRSLLGTLDDHLAPGTYFIDNLDGTPTPQIVVTVGEGWVKDYSNGPILNKVGKSGDLGDGDGFMMFSQPAAVFRDACHPGLDQPSYRGPVTTLDGLVAALTEQLGWAEVTAPSDISIDGYAGKAIQRTAPADMSDCETMPSYSPRVRTGSAPYPVFLSWVNETDPFSGGGPYEPGQIETLLILDLDGTLVVINTRPYPEASATAHAEFAALLDSIRIERA